MKKGNQQIVGVSVRDRYGGFQFFRPTDRSVIGVPEIRGLNGSSGKLYDKLLQVSGACTQIRPNCGYGWTGRNRGTVIERPGFFICSWSTIKLKSRTRTGNKATQRSAILIYDRGNGFV